MTTKGTSMKNKMGLGLVLGLVVLATACTREADIASQNVSNAADNFQVQRRITFINGITNTTMLKIEGRCSLGNNDPQYRLSVTCKTGPAAYKKDFLGVSDNVTYVVEQLEDSAVDSYHYEVVLTPGAIIPDLKIR